MYIVSVEHLTGKRKRKYKVRLDNGTDFCLYEKEVKAFDIREECELPDTTYEKILQTVLIPRAKRRALYLLEKQDRTTKELDRKLKQSGYPQEAICEALSYVASFHYTDDLRYARQYVSYHQQDKSKRRIKEDLMKKGVKTDIIEEAMDAYTVCEEELILTLLEKKGYCTKTADRKEKEKMYRFLASRGFSSEDILNNI